MNQEATLLSSLSQNLEGSQILHYSNAVKSLIAKGKDVFNFTVGDFNPSIFPIPIELKKEAMKAYAEDYTNYPIAEGNADLRSAIRIFEKEWNDLSYDIDEILVASGGRPLIYAAFKAICDEGDGVIYGLPSWNTDYYVQLVGARAIPITTYQEDGFLLTAQTLEPYLKEAVMLCICAPQNPTGTVYAKSELSAICSMVAHENASRGPSQKKLYILFDAMYGNLVSKGFEQTNPVLLSPSLRPYVITINAISKIFAATGLRVGWCLGTKHVLSKMKNLLTHLGAWAPMPEQKAVARFLPSSISVSRYLRSFKSELNDRHYKIHSGIMTLRNQGIPIDALIPRGGLYLSLHIDIVGKMAKGKILETAPDVAGFLLQHAGIAVLPFSVFGASNTLPWFRLSVGTCRMEDIPVMLQNLRIVLKPFAKKQDNIHEVISATTVSQ
jgi:aspartate aminotransferase